MFVSPYIVDDYYSLDFWSVQVLHSRIHFILSILVIVHRFVAISAAPIKSTIVAAAHITDPCHSPDSDGNTERSSTKVVFNDITRASTVCYATCRSC